MNKKTKSDATLVERSERLKIYSIQTVVAGSNTHISFCFRCWWAPLRLRLLFRCICRSKSVTEAFNSRTYVGTDSGCLIQKHSSFVPVPHYFRCEKNHFFISCLSTAVSPYRRSTLWTNFKDLIASHYCESHANNKNVDSWQHNTAVIHRTEPEQRMEMIFMIESMDRCNYSRESEQQNVRGVRLCIGAHFVLTCESAQWQLEHTRESKWTDRTEKKQKPNWQQPPAGSQMA